MTNEKTIRSIERYERDSIISESTKGLKTAIKIILGSVLFIIILTVYSVCSSVYNINIYAGHIVLIIFIAAILYFFITPVYKLIKKSYFILDYDETTVKKVNEHNDKVIISMAENIVNLSENIEGESWYDEIVVEELKKHLSSNDIVSLRISMTQMINTSIRKKSNDIIIKWAVKTGVLTAISQSDVIDSVFVVIINLLLVKDLVFLYGFRYSAFRLLKTFIGVFVSAATAYGLQNANLGKNLLSVASGILRKLGRSISVPTTVLTSAIEVVADSGAQGMGNALMTAFIGYQAIGYLNKEYSLQNELKGIDLLDEDYEFKETVNEIKKGMKEELNNANKNKKNA